jgi:hypothetical protein
MEKENLLGMHSVFRNLDCESWYMGQIRYQEMLSLVMEIGWWGKRIYVIHYTKNKIN